ncbi:MAG TPA: hypothetical protein VGQ38_03270 [Gaiellaceae bacterium]|jgi:hypothetical protein|nr:hypothetical protein [Gaiellaceae bacterium]
MPHDHEPSPQHKHPTWLYIVIGVGLLILVIAGTAVYRGHHESARAKQKAEQLNQAFAAAGLETADVNELAGTLGTDGGAVCEDPGSTLSKSLLKINLAAGAGGIGQRPITIDKDALRGQYLILKTYCPEKLGKFATLFDGLDYDDTIKQ